MICVLQVMRNKVKQVDICEEVFVLNLFFFYKSKSQLKPKNYLKEVTEAAVYENQLSSVQK